MPTGSPWSGRPRPANVKGRPNNPDAQAENRLFADIAGEFEREQRRWSELTVVCDVAKNISPRQDDSRLAKSACELGVASELKVMTARLNYSSSTRSTRP